jgi:putative protease
MPERKVGKVTHYYPRVHAAVVSMENGRIKKGDTVHIKGMHDDLVERVSSLELDHEPIEEARAGQSIGLEVVAPVHEGADVFLVEEQRGFFARLFGR